LRLLVECRRDAELTSMRLFGDGIGIWNDQRQFRVEPDLITAVLRALSDADFPGLSDSYGGGEEDVPQPAAGQPSPGGGRMVLVATCRIELTLGGRHKQVVQLAEGEQSPVLKKLAEDLLGICEAPARSGITASSLKEGLEKIARGELAPEAWVVVLHRKPDEASAREGHLGFLLRVSGSEASTRTYDQAAGYREPVVLGLSSEELRSLASALAARDPEAWPVNLYAPDYTDLSLELLNHQKSIQARQFAGMEPTTHGQHQKAFEEVFELLYQLHRKVLEHGRPMSDRSAP
jgi:hypothetical protein